MNDTPADAIDLKPCPWCGGPAHRIEPMGEWLPKGPPHYGPNKVRYVCAALYEDPIRGCPSRQSFAQEDEAEAIAAWNTRTTSLAAQDEWRCHKCKRVIASATEPEQCAECRCRAFSKIDPTPSLAAQVGLVERVARAMYEDRASECANPIPWDCTSSQDIWFKQARAALASIEVKS